ncbi:Ig-like domain repeat protein [Pseudomonas fluorescens]|uniref:Ig-like domain repeat protein n=1 Tax=Pseudomonas fluorescens TaxID=294 RepID=A0A5E6QR15_PSEFL|nr:Ig-like domain repeat protein [Pseudomonas fluorescens]VVM58672.1 hypothetical protein PS624_01176 [Pseudomonas fluorescens]
MSDNDPSNNAPRLLKELDIPGRTGPVSPTPLIWGINRGALLDNFPRQGLLCRAGPWGTMGLRDSLRILRDADVQIGLEIVDKDEVDTELQMFVEAKHLPEGMHAISYAVTRLGGTPEHSEVMQVLVKLTLPGGPDHSEGPGHPELVMRIPEEILKDGVHQDNIGTGISITLGKADGSPPYPFAAAGDTPQFSWGGVFVSGPALTQEQAEGKTPVIVTIPKKTIVDAGDSGEAGLAVAFEVYDLVHNRSDGWSVEQRVVVTLDETRLGAPLLKEALNNVLDVDKLGDADGTVQVMAVNPSPPRPIDFEVGDTIFVRIKGTPKEGPPIDIELPAKVLISVPSVPEITVSNAVLRQLAQAQIALSYRLEKADGSAQRNAKTQFISAIGEIHRLAAPVALEAKQGAIDPLDPDLKQVTIEIAFDPAFDVGQAIKLFWLGTRPDLSTYLPNLNLRPITQGDMDAQLPLQIIVDKQHLTPIIGGKLELYYQLLIDDSVLATMSKLNQTHAIRESIHADILQIGEPRKELPEPTVDGVVNGALPADTSSTTLTVNYLKTFKDDIVTRFWEGSITGVNNDWVKLSAITAGQPVPFTIKAELIKGNEGGTVKASYELKRAAGGTSYSDTLEFSVGVALENPLPLPQMPEATGNGASVTLAPLDTQAGARVIVAYIGMNEKHNIKLTMAGTPGVGSPDIPAKPGVASGSVEFLIPATAIAANIGNETKTFTLSYEVTAGQTTPSLPLTVSVTPLPATELDKISIEQAEGTVLDLSKVTLGATILAGVWAFIAANHRVGLNLKGTKNNGDAFHHVVWPWPSSYVNQNWFNSGQYTHTLAYNAIKDLADGSRLELHFKAALTLSREEAEAIDAPVKVYTIRAIEDVTPSITLVTGSPSGDEVIEGAIIVETAVTLTGSAAKGQKVSVLDGTTSKGEPTADSATGIWTLAVTGLSVAPHSFTARALYGSGASSAARTLIVTAVVVPTLSNVWDASNVEVLEGKTKVSTELTLKGTASLGQQINIRDGTGSGSATRGTATASGTTGIWELPITVPLGARRLYAEACYPSNPLYSNVRNLTVTEDIAPTIDSVIGTVSGDEIPQNGTTVETAVTLSGVAAKGQQIEVFDGTNPKGKATADPETGIWELLVTGLSVATYNFKAKALYGTGSESSTWKITVSPAVISENFDNQPHQKIVAGQSITIPSMTITYLSGPGKIGIFNEVNHYPTVPGRREGNFLNTGDSPQVGNQHIRLNFNSSYRAIRFWHSYANTLITVNIYRNDNSLIDTKHINGNNIATPLLFEFKSEGIARIDLIHAWDWYALDFFSLEV